MPQGRREPVLTAGVMLQQDSDQGIAVNKDGTPCTTGRPFGVLMDKGNAGEFKAVCRMGFIPVKAIAAAGGNTGVRITPGAGGAWAVAAGTAASPYSAVLEEDVSADGALAGAWVNVLDQLTV